MDSEYKLDNKFANCRSMQNIQVLTQSGGVNKYVCKYIGQVDEQNYVVVNIGDHTKGSLVTKYTFLNKTKISTNKVNQERLQIENK